MARNPKVGEYVLDKYYRKRRQVKAVPKKGGSLYFIGSDHEPVRRNEFIYPLPSKAKRKSKAKKKSKFLGIF